MQQKFAASKRSKLPNLARTRMTKAGRRDASHSGTQTQLHRLIMSELRQQRLRHISMICLQIESSRLNKQFTCYNQNVVHVSCGNNRIVFEFVLLTTRSHQLGQT